MKQKGDLYCHPINPFPLHTINKCKSIAFQNQHIQPNIHPCVRNKLSVVILHWPHEYFEINYSFIVGLQLLMMPLEVVLRQDCVVTSNPPPSIWWLDQSHSVQWFAVLSSSWGVGLPSGRALGEPQVHLVQESVQLYQEMFSSKQVRSNYCSPS